mmetsp:Transcript_131535/g.228656  ORF Transcript_131535/g.228656 Transcript_131535/m.228656 type:complete len:296 (-) Transcript_131535:68-955(-)
MASCREGGATLPGFGKEPCEVQLADVAEQELLSGCDGAAEIAEEDELRYSAAMDRVQAVAEQVEEFLARFSLQERRAIQEPFLLRPGTLKAQPPSLPPTAPTSPVGFKGDQRGFDLYVPDGAIGAAVEPHIDEARRFICTYLSMYPENEQCLALARIGISTRPGLNRSSSSAEFLNMRRKVRLSPMHRIAKVNTATRELLRLKALKTDALLKCPPSGQQPPKPELRRVIETFQCFDAEGTGTISREQLACVLKMLNPVLVDCNLDSFLEKRWCGNSVDYAAFAAWVFQESSAIGG